MLVFILVAAGAIFLAIVALGMVQATAATLGIRLIVHPLTAPVGLLVAHSVVIKLFERGDWSYVSLNGSAARPRRWGAALLLGAAAVGVPSAALLAAGWLAAIPSAEGSSLATAGYLGWTLIPAAFGEELLARGYVFALLREAWGWRSSLLVTSVGFALLHLANPGANPQAILTVVLAGVFLGLVLVRTASLYAAWAAHAAWNFTLAAVLHADVSGIAFAGTPDYRVVDSGPDWLTGGSWGPEGGIAAAAGLLVASILVMRPLLKEHGARPTDAT